MEDFFFVFSNDFNGIYNCTHAFGKGVYFARNASYSLDYSESCFENDGNEYKYMSYCRVICGDYCQGESDMVTPDNKTDQNIQYETMVDNVVYPTIFVSTVDNQAYPLALIRIKMR